MARKKRYDVPLSVAARELAASWPVTYNLILRGELDGEQRESGRWFVTRASLDKAKRERDAKAAD